MTPVSSPEGHRDVWWYEVVGSVTVPGGRSGGRSVGVARAPGPVRSIGPEGDSVRVSAIGVATVCDADNQDDERVIVDGVEHSVVALAHPVDRR